MSLQKKTTLVKPKSIEKPGDSKKQTAKKDLNQIDEQKSQEVAVVVPVFAGDTFKFGNLPKPKMTQYNNGMTCDAFEQEPYCVQLEKRNNRKTTRITSNESPNRRNDDRQEEKKNTKEGEAPIIYEPNKAQIENWLLESKQIADEIKKNGKRQEMVNRLEAQPRMDESPQKTHDTSVSNNVTEN